MDIGSIIGIIAGFVFIIISIVLKGGSAAVLNFVDFPSFMITIGGAFSALLISFPLKKYISGLKSVKHIFNNYESDELEIINKIIDLANIARKEGLLALEEKANEMDDKFLKKGILLIVDGTEAELVRNVLETELNFIETRHQENISFWETLGTLAPAWGMIGTLIGLINMLKNLSDPSNIGKDMSVALVTTLYGSLLANLLAVPIATKLKDKSELEIFTKELTIEGLLSIQSGENPRIIEEKLKAFLSPKSRDSLKDVSSELEQGVGA